MLHGLYRSCRSVALIGTLISLLVFSGLVEAGSRDYSGQLDTSDPVTDQAPCDNASQSAYQAHGAFQVTQSGVYPLTLVITDTNDANTAFIVALISPSNTPQSWIGFHEAGQDNQRVDANLQADTTYYLFTLDCHVIRDNASLDYIDYTFSLSGAGDIINPPNVTPSPEPTTPSPEPTTPSPEPTTPSPEPTTPSPEPTTPSPEPTTPSPEPTTPSPEPTTPSPEPTTPSPEPTTPSPEPTTPSPEPTTPSPEPTTPSPEPTTPSPEPTTPSPEPTTPSPEPTTPSPESDEIVTTPAPTPEPPPDDRINWRHGDFDVVIYRLAAGDGVVAYCYHNTAWVAWVINQAMLDAHVPDVDQRVPIQSYQQDDCRVAFYRLDSGEYQINIWSAEGKIYEILADNIGFFNPIFRYYDANE